MHQDHEPLPQRRAQRAMYRPIMKALVSQGGISMNVDSCGRVGVTSALSQMAFSPRSRCAA